MTLLTKEDERRALDRLGWYHQRDVVYSIPISKKVKEFQIMYVNYPRFVLITYREEAGGIEVTEIVECLNGN